VPTRLARHRLLQHSSFAVPGFIIRRPSSPRRRQLSPRGEGSVLTAAFDGGSAQDVFPRTSVSRNRNSFQYGNMLPELWSLAQNGRISSCTRENKGKILHDRSSSLVLRMLKSSRRLQCVLFVTEPKVRPLSRETTTTCCSNLSFSLSPVPGHFLC
jgi:hypothetical protein